MASPIPASVSRRKRLVLAGDIFLGLGHRDGSPALHRAQLV